MSIKSYGLKIHPGDVRAEAYFDWLDGKGSSPIAPGFGARFLQKSVLVYCNQADRGDSVADFKRRWEALSVNAGEICIDASKKTVRELSRYYSQGTILQFWDTDVLGEGYNQCEFIRKVAEGLGFEVRGVGHAWRVLDEHEAPCLVIARDFDDASNFASRFGDRRNRPRFAFLTEPEQVLKFMGKKGLTFALAPRAHENPRLSLCLSMLKGVAEPWSY